MKSKAIMSFLLFFISFNVLGETYKPVDSLNHRYYICLKGMVKKEEAFDLVSKIATKPGVIQFIHNRMYIDCFFMKTSSLISQQQFEQWIKPYGYDVLVFGDKLKDEAQSFKKSRLGEWY